MGWRFRKSISAGKLLRLNFSSSGVSVGLGPPGLNVNIGPRGIRRTVGLPGTGIYYQNSSRWPAAASPAATQTQGPVPPSPPAGGGTSPVLSNGEVPRTRIPWVTLAVIAVILWLVAQLADRVWHGKDVRAPTTQSRQTAPSTPHIAATTPPPAPQLEDRALSSAEIKTLQMLLNQRGFQAGPPDGNAGPRTRSAIQAFMRSQGEDAKDEATLRVLERALNASR